MEVKRLFLPIICKQLRAINSGHAWLIGQSGRAAAQVVLRNNNDLSEIHGTCLSITFITLITYHMILAGSAFYQI